MENHNNQKHNNTHSNPHKTHKSEISNTPKSKNNILKTILAFLVIVVAFYMLTSAKVVTTEDCTEEKIVQEPVIEEVPYNITEVYYEKECMGDEYCKYRSYSFSTYLKGRLESIDNQIYYICDIFIKNNENVSGEWEIHAVFKSDGKLVNESEPLRKEVGPGKEEKFTFMIPWEEGKVISCERVNDDIPVLKTDCVCSYYKNVKKYRTVTKYKNITIYKNVTKIVPSESCSEDSGEVIFKNRFFGYTQPFYLGY